MNSHVLAFVSLLGLSSGVAAQAPTPLIARSEANHGGISIQQADGRYLPQRSKTMLPADQLLVLLPGSTLSNNSNTVGLTAVGDYDGLSPLPVLETAVRLRESDRYDLAVVLERGRVDFENRKKSGPVLIEVRFADQKWLITLEKAGSHVTIEVASRWAAGTRYQKMPPPGHSPVTQAVLVVWQGTAEVDTAQTTLAMKAPPGPAELRWSSLSGNAVLTRLDRLPPWANPKRTLTPITVQSRVAVEQFRELWMLRSDAAYDTLLKSNRAADRRVGLVAAGAFDELTLLAEVISTTTELDVWDFGITVARHWLGRGPEQEQKLYQFLIEQRQFTAAHAETLIGLLNGFTTAEQARPETYEVLIEYLQHDQPTIRNLAAWHLVRLVPAGKSIPFRPNSSKEQFRQTYNRWKELIPPGRLPPKAN